MHTIFVLTTFIAASTACHPGWLSNSGSCYLFAQVNLDYLSSRDYCVGLSAHLVHINDAAENTFIRTKALSFDAKAWWLGLSDLEEEGVFKWVDDDSTLTGFTDWYPGQPNDLHNHEDCVNLYKGYNMTWNDYNCLQHVAHPICEKPDTVAI